MQNLPPALKELLSGAESEEITIGRSGTDVYVFPELREYGKVYLKIAAPESGIDLEREKELLDWLNGRLPVPKVLYFEQDNGKDYLLVSEIEGVDCAVFTAQSTQDSEILNLAAQLSVCLRQIHAVSIEDCPFPQNLSVKLRHAKERIAQGWVDETDFKEEHLGKSADEIYRWLAEQNIGDEDLVFTHGDFCLPNIIINNNKINGIIDWERGGVADRYQDIALFFRSFALNTENAFDVEEVFCTHYGISRLDKEKIRFYIDLDELF